MILCYDIFNVRDRVDFLIMEVCSVVFTFKTLNDTIFNIE